MARGRMINQKITKDLDFNEMSIDAQFLFMRTIPYLDRDGLVTGHSALLWSSIAPLLPQYANKMTEITNEWVSAGFVIKYMDGKTPVLFFKGFHKNQSLTHYEREAASEFAPPPGYQRTPKGIRLIDGDDNGGQPQEEPKSKSSNDTEQLRTNSGLTPDQIPVKGKEIEIEKNTTLPCAREAEPEPKSGSGGGSLPSHRNRNSDMEYARLCHKFENEGFGTLTAIMAEEINALMNEYPVDWIDDAMSVSVKANKRQLRYAKGILVRWRSEGRNESKHSPGQSPPTKQVMDFKRWMLANYNCDKPQFVSDVPEALIRAQYEQYKHQSEQTH